MPKSKAPEQRASAQEKALAQISMQRDQRHEQAFRPLEQAAIAELDTADAAKRSAMIAGRQNADLEASAAASREQGLRIDSKAGTFGSGATTARGLRRAGAVESGRTAIMTGADQMARDSIDTDTLNVIRTGQDQARQTQSGLTASARMANSKAASKLRAQEMKDQARHNAMMELGTSAILAGKAGYDKATAQVRKANPNMVDNLTEDVIPGGYHMDYATPTGELNWAQQGFRRLHEAI